MYIHAASASCIVPDFIQRRSCWRMTLWKDLHDASQQFGGAVKGGDHSQWAEDEFVQINDSQFRQFSFLIPDTLVVDPPWLLIAAFHSRNLSIGTIWSANITPDNLLRVVINKPNSASPSGYGVHSTTDFEIRRGRWYDVQFVQNLTVPPDVGGNLQLSINDGSGWCKIVSQYTPLIFPGEAATLSPPGMGPYLQYGPYNFEPNMTADEQTIFMQCGFRPYGF